MNPDSLELSPAPELSQPLVPTVLPSILWEDEHMAVLSKPAGIVVNRADSVKSYTVQDWAEAQWDQLPQWKASLSDPEFSERLGMVHRLDKDTSGVMLWAKTSEAMHELMHQFQQREVEKTYLALVHGKLPEPSGVIRAPIDRNPQNRTKFTVTSEGRPSETHFRVTQTFPALTADTLRAFCEQVGLPAERWFTSARNLYEGGFSLVELQPKTGRTHQIRVHMDYLHHPLVGDERYTGRKRARLDSLWCKRQWLHAWKISCLHPITGEPLVAEAPIPADLTPSLDLIREKSE